MLHHVACEEHAFTFHEFLLSVTARTKKFSLSVKKMYSETLSLSSIDTANKGSFQPLAPVHTQSFVRAVAKHLALDEEQASPEPVAERSSILTTLWESRRFCLRRTTKPSRLLPELTFTPPPHMRRRPGSSYGHKVTAIVVESANPNGVRPPESRRARSRWKCAALSGGRRRDASCLEKTSTVERAQAKAQSLKHERSAYSVSKS